MKVNPNDAELIKDGSEVIFRVIEALDTLSAKNEEQLRLVLSVEDANGKPSKIFCYLSSPMKLKQFCLSAGLLEYFNKGEVTANHCFDSVGKAIVGLQVDPNGVWDDKNIIRKFIEAPFQQEINKDSTKDADDFSKEYDDNF